MRTLGTSNWTGFASVQAFSTVFTERIYADYDSLPNAILYRNVDGFGWNRGLSVDLWLNGTKDCNAQQGRLGCVPDCTSARRRPRDTREFAPNWTSNVNVGHSGRNGDGISLPNRGANGRPFTMTEGRSR